MRKFVIMVFMGEAIQLPLVIGDTANSEGCPIDTDFPVESASRLARLEVYNKHLFRPNTYLHKWWARRCGTTFRFVLKQLVSAPSQRDFYAPGGLEGKIVLDPMMGGGTTLHEAIRLGANVIGADIDPIPVLQVCASLSHIPIPTIARAFEDFYQSLRAELVPFYLTPCPLCDQEAEAQFYLYGVRKQCACGEAILVDSFVLRQEEDHCICLCPQCHLVFDGQACSCKGSDLQPAPPYPLYEKSVGSCPTCGERFRDIYEEAFYRRYECLAVVGTCPTHGFFIKAPSPSDREALEQANALRPTLVFESILPFDVSEGPKSGDLLRNGVSDYRDVFASRQLLFLKSASQALARITSDSIRLLLALLISTSLEFNAMLCGYKGGSRQRPGAVRHVFAHHAYTFPYTALENNPIFTHPASGNLQHLFRSRILGARKWACAPRERRQKARGQAKWTTIQGEVDFGSEVGSPDALRDGSRRFLLYQCDARHLPLPSASVDYVVTDPPYMDSVQYSNLAEFFRVWLAYLLPGEATWAYDENASAVGERFGEILTGIFRESKRVLLPQSGRLIFTFHHWKARAWADLTLALKAGGFYLRSFYVVPSENPVSVHINNLRALKHDCILAFTPGPNGQAWPPIEAIPTDDSYRFCLGCGQALGWLLLEDHTNYSVYKIWGKLIGA